MRAAEAAEILQRLARLRSEQIMDRVEHRPRVRLHRDAVVRPERVEIERGHDRGHRSAARLMAADLQPVVVLADVVGVVDRPRRQPAQPLVDCLQRFDVGRDGLEHGAAPSPFFQTGKLSGGQRRAPDMTGQFGSEQQRESRHERQHHRADVKASGCAASLAPQDGHSERPELRQGVDRRAAEREHAGRGARPATR